MFCYLILLVLQCAISSLAADKQDSICRQVNEHKSINLMTAGLRGEYLLLITSKETNFLVYDLSSTSLEHGRLDLLKVVPVPLEKKWPDLYSSDDFRKIRNADQKVHSFTHRQKDNDYLVILVQQVKTTIFTGLVYEFQSRKVYPKTYNLEVIDDAEEVEFLSTPNLVYSMSKASNGTATLVAYAFSRSSITDPSSVMQPLGSRFVCDEGLGVIKLQTAHCDSLIFTYPMMVGFALQKQFYLFDWPQNWVLSMREFTLNDSAEIQFAKKWNWEFFICPTPPPTSTVTHFNRSSTKPYWTTTGNVSQNSSTKIWTSTTERLFFHLFTLKTLIMISVGIIVLVLIVLVLIICCCCCCCGKSKNSTTDSVSSNKRTTKATISASTRQTRAKTNRSKPMQNSKKTSNSNAKTQMTSMATASSKAKASFTKPKQSKPNVPKHSLTAMKIPNQERFTSARLVSKNMPQSLESISISERKKAPQDLGLPNGSKTSYSSLSNVTTSVNRPGGSSIGKIKGSLISRGK